MRKQKKISHVLTGNKTIRTANRIVFFDSESHVQVDITEVDIAKVENGYIVHKPHEPYLVGATFINRKGGKHGNKQIETEKDYHSEKEFLDRFWSDVDGFANWRERTYMYAHNAKYDTLVMGAVPRLVKLGYQVESFSDSNPFFLRLYKERGEGKKKDRKTLIILSSTNYYAQSLKKLGDIFGLPKLDFAHGQPFKLEDAITYCRRDVDILKTAVLAFLDFVVKEDLGTLKDTVAGQSFQAFKHRFLDYELEVHAFSDVSKVERRCYAGGRNECFRMGHTQEHIYGVDVNSMYPSVMVNGLFPVKFECPRKSMGIPLLKQIIEEDGFLVCADCYVDTPYPIFHQKGERLTFPTGKFWTSLSTPEIVEGIKRGIIKKVKNVQLYHGAPVFEKFVNYFYKMRLEAKKIKDAIHDQLYKLFMNSLYGKFGQMNKNWERVGEAAPDEIRSEIFYDADEDDAYHIKVFGGGVFRRNNEDDRMEAWDSFPAIAAHVTAAARMLLWRYIECACGGEFDETGRPLHVYYTDTDSLFVDRDGYTRLEAAGYIDSKKLGLLDLEKQGSMTLYGCKDYVFIHRKRLRVNGESMSVPWVAVKKGKMEKAMITKIKGVTKSSILLPPDAEGRTRFIATVWNGYSVGLRAGNLTDYSNTLQIKTLKREYKKGNVVGDIVTPFVLNEPQSLII